jgi:hypothetical protein
VGAHAVARGAADGVEAIPLGSRRRRGPKTSAGKARVARNPIKHGISCSRRLVPGESSNEWETHRRAFVEDLAPQYPPTSFAVPAGVTTVKIDATNGRVANLFCPVVISETFLTGTEPAPCEEHGGVPAPIRNLWRRFSDWLRR